MIDILLATYNGEKYLKEQIDSLLNQSYQDWHLIVGDDCSKDRTLDILEWYRELYPNKIEIHVNEVPSGGAKHNFYNLMTFSKGDYIMFCDQDDVWLENKIEITLKKMITAEEKYGRDVPILVHSDLCVVDSKLNVINKSLFAMQNLDYRKNRINKLLVSNIVTGCTMMINRSLKIKAKNKPDTFVMHDMWLALVASVFGKIKYINDSTILYRQHSNNSVGAKDVNSLMYILMKISSIRDVKKNLSRQYQQANEFLKIYGDDLECKEYTILKEYSNFSHMNIIEKYRVLKKYKMFKSGLIRSAAQLII